MTVVLRACLPTCSRRYARSLPCRRLLLPTAHHRRPRELRGAPDLGAQRSGGAQDGIAGALGYFSFVLCEGRGIEKTPRSPSLPRAAAGRPLDPADSHSSSSPPPSPSPEAAAGQSPGGVGGGEVPAPPRMGPSARAAASGRGRGGGEVRGWDGGSGARWCCGGYTGCGGCVAAPARSSSSPWIHGRAVVRRWASTAVWGASGSRARPSGGGRLLPQCSRAPGYLGQPPLDLELPDLAAGGG